MIDRPCAHEGPWPAGSVPLPLFSMRSWPPAWGGDVGGALRWGPEDSCSAWEHIGDLEPGNAPGDSRPRTRVS